MTFRPGCPRVTTSCTWTSSRFCGSPDQLGNGLLSLALLIAWGSEKCSERGSKYQIGITWFNFIQGYFLWSIISSKSFTLRVQWEVIWDSLMTSNFCHSCQGSKKSILAHAIPSQSLPCPPKLLQEAFLREFTSRCFSFHRGSVNFPEHSLSMSTDSPLSH